ncbi:PAS domain-containing protein [Niabella sp. W65]|nr:PAS domain-containing protein [Niabella sp. W65]MCH7363574.1 PAS domain-containing protein [Niabella sp. W65]ULT39488.1 PAS domain-containing protein [Niabella sp. I65]
MSSIVNLNERTDGLSFDLLFGALNASVSGIIITDNLQPDNPIIYCNQAFERISGYERSQIIGHNCRFLQEKIDRKAQGWRLHRQ